MVAKIGHLKLFGYNFTFVFRHKYEKYDNEGEQILDMMSEWRNWEIGFWYKRYQVVGSRNFHKSKEWDNNLVYEHMFGINLLFCKAWMTIQRGAMILGKD
jgi:hypothetical protein